MVTIKNLHKSYGKFKVLDGLDMNVADGEVYGFLGKNGCGKSTTMNILCDIIPKDGGDVLLGNEGSDNSVRIGYLPETPSMFTYMNGYEYLRYIAACCQYKGDVEQRIREVLDIVGMTEGGKRRIKGYSRGMNQRLGIASIIFDNPNLLILDEPTSALDPEGRSDVMRIIRQLSETGCTIILCTHILSDVEKVAGSIGILVNGKMSVEGKITDIEKQFSRPEVELKLYDTDQRAVDIIKALENEPVIEKVDFYERTGIFVLRTPQPKSATEILTKTLAQNSLVPMECKTVTESLEEIYLKVVNGNA